MQLAVAMAICPCLIRRIGSTRIRFCINL